MSVNISDEEKSAIVAGNLGGRMAKSLFNRLTNKKKTEPLSIDEHWGLLRACGFLGRPVDARNTSEALRAAIRQIRKHEERFEKRRRAIAASMMDVGRPQMAIKDVQRFVAPDAVSNSTPIVERLDTLIDTFGPELDKITQWLDGTGAQNSFEADLGLVTQFSLISEPYNEPIDLPPTINEVFCTTARLAREAGLTVALIPDYMFPLLERRPAHILTFHTAGELPGFVHFKRADLPDYLLIDEGGYSGWSSLSGRNINELEMPPLEESRLFFEKIYDDVVRANVSKYHQPSQGVAEPLPDRYVFVALQVPQDRTQLKARFTMAEMLRIVIERFKDTDISVVVKPHPLANDQVLTAMLNDHAEKEAIVLRYDSIHDLLSGAEAVITVNSGVGSEAMLHRKPIYAFGASDYDPVTHRITKAEDFTAATTPIRPAVTDEEMMRFVAYYRTIYLVDRTQTGKLEKAIQERVIDPILRAKRG